MTARVVTRMAKRSLVNLARHHARADIESACASLLERATTSYRVLKRLLEQRAAECEVAAVEVVPTLAQSGADIRDLDAYQDFFEQHAHGAEPSPFTANRKEQPL
jgi:hypothetical protein